MLNHTGSQCGYLLYAAILPVRNCLRFQFAPDAACRWNMNTSATAITAGRRLIGKGCPKRALFQRRWATKNLIIRSIRRIIGAVAISHFVTAPIHRESIRIVHNPRHLVWLNIYPAIHVFLHSL